MYAAVAPGKTDQGVVLAACYFYVIDETHPGIVLTPACDIEQSKAELIQTCALFDAWNFVAELLRTDWAGLGLVSGSGELLRDPLSTSKRKELNNRILQIVRQRIPRYHWLSPLPGTDRPLIADFQVLASVPTGELVDVPLLAALESPYREQIAARYAAYMGRVGTPDFTDAETESWITAGLGELFPNG